MTKPAQAAKGGARLLYGRPATLTATGARLAELKNGPTFAASAVNDLGATGSTVDGLSIQRIDNNDTNTSADWTTLAGVPSTWGASNPGQTEFPPSSRSARRFE